MLNDEELSQLRDNLAHLSESAVKDFYNHAHRDCAIIGQQLVTAWKQLRKWRK